MVKTVTDKIKELTWADLIKKLRDIFLDFNYKFNSLTERVSAVETSSSGGGGGSQDLQSVLDIGNIVINESTEIIFRDEADIDFEGTYSSVERGQVTVVVDGIKQTSLQGDNIILQNGSTTNYLQSNLLSDVGGLVINLPKYTNGVEEVTLATLDDISLQSVLDGGKIAEYNSGNQFIRIFEPTENATGVEIGSIADDKQSYFAVYENGFIAVSSDSIEASSSSISTENNLIKFKQGKNSNNTVLSFVEPIEAGAEIQIPAKPTGTYTLATLDDIYKIPSVPIYADNATAILGGLVADNIYKTVTGELRIVV